jgi:hypothetical protein
MDFRLAARPVARALCAARCLNQPLVATRGHKTAVRTKRALKIAPHDSFLPDRTTVFPAADSIIYNPPSSEATPFHTPSIFMPENDARRRALQRMEGHPGAPSGAQHELPPTMNYYRRAENPSYHVTPEQIQEMRALRKQDPLTWTVSKLAAKFECSPVFVKLAAPASPEHVKWMKERDARREARWGPIKTRAMADRKRRREMVLRGEI